MKAGSLIRGRVLGRSWTSASGGNRKQDADPLGGIIAKRGLGDELIKKIEAGIRKSLEYAFAHNAEPKAYIKEYSQEVEDNVIEQHIDLYVNDYSLDIGEDGLKAVEELFRMSEEKGIIKASSRPLCV